MSWPCALLLSLGVVAQSIRGRELTAPRSALPFKSHIRVSSVTARLQGVGRHLSKSYPVQQLQELNATSSWSERLFSSSTSYASTSTPTTSCAESVNGVSLTTRVVVNGTRFGACYNNVTFQFNDYPAYLTSRTEEGILVRGDEGLVVVELLNTITNETSLFWTLARLKPDELEIDEVICYNLVDFSPSSSPTSSLFNGLWLCDVDRDGESHYVDDIKVECGCTNGTDAEEYYSCEEYEDLALESSSGIVFKGVSLDGCYTINTMINISGYYGYFAGPTEDGVATVFVDNYVNATDETSRLRWSVGIYYENGVDRACFLDPVGWNSSVGPASPLSEGDWFCNFNGDRDGLYERYDGDLVVHCACIDDTYTTCFEYGEGLSLDSGIVYDGEPIAGCYLPTNYLSQNTILFARAGEEEPSTRKFQVSLTFLEDETIDFKGNAWTVTRIVSFDEDADALATKIICIAPVANVDLPTDPLLRGRWGCTDETGQFLSDQFADFEEMVCGCRSNISSASTDVPFGTPSPTPDATFLPSTDVLFPTSTPESAIRAEPSLPSSSTRLPVGSGANASEEVASDSSAETASIGTIVGGGIGGALLVFGVVSIILCRKSSSRSRERHSVISPKVTPSIGGQSLQSPVNNIFAATVVDSVPPVNCGRPLGSNGAKIGLPSPPTYEEARNHSVLQGRCGHP